MLFEQIDLAFLNNFHSHSWRNFFKTSLSLAMLATLGFQSAESIASSPAILADSVQVIRGEESQNNITFRRLPYATHNPTHGPINSSTRNYIFQVVGYGVGMSVQGRRQKACEIAFERALEDVYEQCEQRRGFIFAISESPSSCNCRKRSASREEILCRLSHRAHCEVIQR